MRTRTRSAARVLGTLLASAIAASVPAAPIAYEEQALETPRGTVHVRVPAGHRLEVLVSGLRQPRLGAFAPDGALVVGSRSGALYRFAPPYTEAQILARLGDYPHSVAFRGDEMLVAQTGGLYRTTYAAGAERLAAPLELVAPLPGGFGHDSRTVRIGPDGNAYVALGLLETCSDEYLDASYPPERRRGGVLRLDESGAEPRWVPFATGLRNPVGFGWHPATGVAYASNNGPDHHGFDQPAEHFARLDPGSFHGMPWFWHDGGQIRRDDCVTSDPPRPAGEVSAPAATFPAHNAPMAVAFVPAGALDPDFEGDAVVALRGSWATRPAGDGSGDPATRREPKLVLVRFAGGVPVGVEDLVTGFQDAAGQRWARPVGAMFGPDGALYFTSDEETNALMRLSRVR